MYADHSTSTERPSIEERYETASNTSDLTLQLDPDLPGGAADVLIANAWSESRLGGALLRLHSEWSASEKPLKPTKESIRALVGTFQAPQRGEPELAEGEKRKPLTGAEAAQYASAWYVHEVAMLLQKLKTLPAVREQVVLVALKWGWHDAENKAAAVLRYWLDQVCGTCHGRKFRLIPGTPSLSNKFCPACGGSGVAQVPHDQEGRRLANHLDSCVYRARQGISNHLRARR